MPLLSRIAIAWMLGLVLARWLDLPWPIIALAALPALAGLGLYRHQPQARATAIFVCSFGLAFKEMLSSEF